MNILEEIIAYKKLEVERTKDALPIEKLKKLASQNKNKKRDFYNILKAKVEKKEIGLITEIKKASPSKGTIRKDFNHIEIAKAYKEGGACCLSVLTDQKYFQGNLNYINDVKGKVDLPVLRKDFIVDPYQIHESIYYGADCILLIASALEKDMFNKLVELSLENNLDVLIEIHNEKEMDIALDIVETCHGMSLLGINNRDLQTFETTLETTKNLISKYKRDLKNKVIVSESGIFTNKDIKSLIEYDIYCFLVGESLIKTSNIEKATRELIS